jgi:transcriptional regulator with XRE-family HTH domain
VSPEDVSVNAPKVRELRRAHGMTQQLLADRAGVSLSYIEKLERGGTRQPSVGTLTAIAAVLNVPLDTLLCQGPRQAAPGPGAARAEPAALTASRGPGGGDRQEPDPSVISAMLAEAASGRAPADTEPLALILTGSAAGAAVCEPGVLPDISALASEADDARRDYQACRYFELASQLPGLLARLDLACAMLDGDARAKASALSADAYHVAAGLLLKLDDQGLACLAADRSMRAAQASADPVMVAASARIITHTLMSGGHLPAAVSAANSYATRLDHDMAPHTPDSLSVYGALLLRGAIAAAQHDDRGSAHELLGEADQAARQFGADGNLRWTAFGPANAALHRVNIAVTLGDAGTAIDVARRVDLSKIAVTERKAALLIDVARAFFQWGRHEKAYVALRAAEATAHEEVAGRPSVRRLVRDLCAAAPPSIRRDVDQFATQIGVPR